VNKIIIARKAIREVKYAFLVAFSSIVDLGCGLSFKLES